MPRNARFLATKVRNVLAQLPYLPRALALVWTAARGWVIAWVCLLIVQGVLPVVTVYLTRALVDSLVAALGTARAWENIGPTLILVALMAGVILLTQVLRSATAWIRTAQSDLVHDCISSLIHGKSIAVDLAFYDEAFTEFDGMVRTQPRPWWAESPRLAFVRPTAQSGTTEGESQPGDQRAARGKYRRGDALYATASTSVLSRKVWLPAR